MTRTKVGEALAAELAATESAVDEALAHSVKLMRALMESRRRAGLPIKVCEPVLRRANAVLDALGEAQRELGRVQGDLQARTSEPDERILRAG